MRIRNVRRNIKKLRRLLKNPAIDLWATDEVHFQQYGSSCRMWIPPEEKDPVLPHFPTRKSVGYFGAVRLRDGKFVFRRETERFNAVSFYAFLKQLRKASSRSGRRVVVITDNARYHHARLHKEWRKTQAGQFSLDFLPPYSPELNPIERVWKLTRRQCLHNRYFSSLAEVIDSAEGQFIKWSSGNEALRKLCAIN